LTDIAFMLKWNWVYESCEKEASLRPAKMVCVLRKLDFILCIQFDVI
jgi:hypothetical protein